MTRLVGMDGSSQDQCTALWLGDYVERCVKHHGMQ
ncbi:hypothetical protein FOXG_22713 [Fusarium oxysporum f. sp. lycopersici 4287]|uniref:Uncharacterized protein n=1 Tax=Fusarium oxysporum f. sp. lycopersici (strain 4287 / CBS 123668 / FGSC 9935 / NRRL 34936) TaxID=426428 RepID=A0A0J9WAU7_FUSO4|nr:hypothetical protein FOXG_22713 [Fusarium oxysporum f. sp. lycopersici 4287]EWZ78898.1 hypothetical protein FOWG_16903 [Fusarium oxysporum f. sp. lycopersici MN25]KNB20003.1 hypothetical protein FOXG_22713 [Fusarium oxysporum f. sp. lycopersici 4287]